MQINKNKFDKDGFLIINNLFNDIELQVFAKQFLSLLKMQGHKIGIKIGEKNKQINQNQNILEIIDLSMKINDKSKNAFDQINQMLREMFLINSTIINNDIFYKVVSKLLNCPLEYIKYHVDGILTNFPSNERRLYKYHVEQAYYPMRNNFLNIWIPLFSQKKINNGIMTIRPEGHKNKYHFIEYSGYSKKEISSLSEDNYFHQYSIPEVELKGLKCKDMILPPGDGVFFHQNMPHKSTMNNSNKPSFAFVMRVYDFRSDYTLSNLNGIKPYTLEATQNGYPEIQIYK